MYTVPDNNLQARIEAMIVDTLQKGLIDKKITGERAREIAVEVLRIIPEHISDNDLIKIIPQLDDQLGELANIVSTIATEQDNHAKEKKLSEIRTVLEQFKNTNN